MDEVNEPGPITCSGGIRLPIAAILQRIMDTQNGDNKDER